MDWASLELEDLGLDDCANLLSGQKKSANSWKIGENTLRLLDESEPIIITFPRAGRHWLMLALECYFQESISYDNSLWSDNSLPNKICFVHEDQCDKGYPPLQNYLCVYRKDIVSCTFSNLWKQYVAIYTPDNRDRLEGLRREKSGDQFLIQQLETTIAWFHKYHPLFSNRNVKEILTFEEMLEDMPGALRKVCNFLGEEYQEEDARRVVRECTKEAVAACVEPGEANLTPHYKELQDTFRKDHSEMIIHYLIEKDPRMVEVIGK